MSKELKKFIDENRSGFDEDLPAASAWNQIERSIGVNKPAKHITARAIYKWTASAVVFLITAACFYFLIIRKNNAHDEIVSTETPAANSSSNTTDISRIAPEFSAEARIIYRSIEIRQLQLNEIADEQPVLFSQFSQDLAALDSSYRLLKTQAAQIPNREVIIRAMLQNLQLQAELLSKQLEILNEFKNYKTGNNEKNNYPRM